MPLLGLFMVGTAVVFFIGGITEEPRFSLACAAAIIGLPALVGYLVKSSGVATGLAVVTMLLMYASTTQYFDVESAYATATQPISCACILAVGAAFADLQPAPFPAPGRCGAGTSGPSPRTEPARSKSARLGLRDPPAAPPLIPG